MTEEEKDDIKAQLDSINEKLRGLRNMVRQIIHEVEREKRIMEGRWVEPVPPRPMSMKGDKQ